MKNKKTILISIIAAVAVIIGGYFLFFKHTTTYQFVTVEKGSITETVSLTGNTTPEKSVSLGFQNTGTIAHIYYNLGDQVNAGDDHRGTQHRESLRGALNRPKRTLAVAEANLASLMAGTRPEQLAIDQSAVTQDQTALDNAITSAYAVSDSAVHTDADQFFTNSRTANAALTFIVPDAALANTRRAGTHRTRAGTRRVECRDYRTLLQLKRSCCGSDTGGAESHASQRFPQ